VGTRAYCRVGDERRDPSLKVWAVEPEHKARIYNLMKERATTQEEFDSFVACLIRVTRPMQNHIPKPRH